MDFRRPSQTCRRFDGTLAGNRPASLVATLPQPERAVLTWRSGPAGPRLTLRAVAANLHCSLGTAWNLEQRALAMLQVGTGSRLSESEASDASRRPSK